MKTFITTLLLIVYIQFSYAQAQSDLQKQVDKQRKQIEQLQLNAVKDSVINTTMGKTYDYKAEFNNFKSEIRETNSTITFFSFLIGGITLTALLAGAYQIFIGFDKKAKQLVESKAKEVGEAAQIEIARLMKEQSRTLQLVLIDKSIETHVKELYKIWVVYAKQEQESNAFIKDFLESNGFTCQFVSIEEILEHKNEIDVVFINNTANGFGYKSENREITNAPLIDSLHGELKNYDTAFFYYCEKGQQHKSDGYKILSYANTKTTIYHNLIDMLRYKYLVIDKKL